MQEKNKNQKITGISRLNLRNAKYRFFIPFIIFWDILIHPKQWNFCDGGWGLPHFNNLDTERGDIVIHYPYLPIWFNIEFGDWFDMGFNEYGNTKIFYPILTLPLMYIIFSYLVITKLVF